MKGLNNENISRSIMQYLKESSLEEKDMNISLDENGLPALDKPYHMGWSEKDEIYYINSAHPYDDSDYSYAKSNESDYTMYWTVFNPNGSKAGVVEGYDEAVELMKEIDSKIKPNPVHN